MPDFGLARTAVPLPSAELNAGGTSTSEVQFTTASANGQVAAGQPLVCYVPGTNVMAYRPFLVRAGGRLGTGVSSNVTVKLYWGSSSTIASNTQIATTGAVAVGTASGTWNLNTQLTWDVASKQIQGKFDGHLYGTAVDTTVLSNTVGTVNLATESTSNGLTLTGQFSAGNASNTLYVDWFEVITQ